MKILDKRQMRALFERGEFGNRLETWCVSNIHSVRLPVVLMYNGVPGVQLPRYCTPIITMQDLKALIAEWVALGCCADNITICENGLDGPYDRCIQGEVQRCEDYLYLYWTDVSDKMRQALARRSYHTTGAAAVAILEYYMDQASWENLNHLWEVYPDSVVEFTVFRKGVGDLGWNTVFWEVRNY